MAIGITGRPGPIARLASAFVDEITDTLARLRMFRPRRPPRLLVQQGSAFQDYRFRRGRPVLAGEGPLESLVSARGRTVPVEVRLDEKHLFSRTIHLPAASRAHLASIVPLQFDRLTPWTDGHAVCAHAVDARDRTCPPGQIAVRLVAMAKPAHARLIQALSEAGFAPVSIGAAQEPLEHAPVADLVASAAPMRRNLRRAVVAALASIAVVGATGVVATELALSRQQAELARTQRLLAAASQQVEEARLAADTALGPSRLLARKWKDTPFVLLLDEVSRAVPADTYLTELFAEEGEIRFSGLSKDASGILTRLEESPFFDTVRFEAAIVRDETRDRDRFSVAARLAEATP